MGKIHKQYSPGFRAKVALEAIKEEETIAEIATRSENYPGERSMEYRYYLHQNEVRLAVLGSHDGLDESFYPLL